MGREALRGLGVAVALLAGCGPGFSLGPREPATVRFAFPGDDDYYAPLIEAFQGDNSYITIEMVSSPYFFYGPPPDGELVFDVALVPPNALQQLIDEQTVVALDPFITEDADFSLDDYYPGAAASMTMEGRTYAIPYMSTMAVMFYNIDLFDKYTVPYPQEGWTWGDFLETARRLTHEDQGEYGFAYQSAGGQLGLLEPMALIYQHGGRLFDDLRNPTRVILNEPLNVEAIQWYADLIHRHRVAARPGARQIPYPVAGIEGGKYAMWMGFLDDEWEDLNTGMAPLPRDQNAFTLGSVFGLAVSSQAEDPQAAWAWLSYISRQPPPFLMPTHRGVAESEAARRLLPATAVDAGRASLPHLVSFGLSQDGPLWRQFGVWISAVEGAIGKIQNGEPVQAALDEAQRTIDNQ